MTSILYESVFPSSAIFYSPKKFCLATGRSLQSFFEESSFCRSYSFVCLFLGSSVLVLSDLISCS
ncbi:unnamed protein product [Nezara viridula]|uniref:Uncharacterized protein n=1 Tax=Nezara viridula TaxID=85310 RepID=A0A9P0E5E1_NEZVI|nr:unnamed protein product [Nezara viridula]